MVDVVKAVDVTPPDVDHALKHGSGRVGRGLRARALGSHARPVWRGSSCWLSVPTPGPLCSSCFSPARGSSQAAARPAGAASRHAWPPRSAAARCYRRRLSLLRKSLGQKPSRRLRPPRESCWLPATAALSRQGSRPRTRPRAPAAVRTTSRTTPTVPARTHQPADLTFRQSGLDYGNCGHRGTKQHQPGDLARQAERTHIGPGVQVCVHPDDGYAQETHRRAADHPHQPGRNAVGDRAEPAMPPARPTAAPRAHQFPPGPVLGRSPSEGRSRAPERPASSATPPTPLQLPLPRTQASTRPCASRCPPSQPGVIRPPASAAAATRPGPGWPRPAPPRPTAAAPAAATAPPSAAAPSASRSAAPSRPSACQLPGCRSPPRPRRPGCRGRRCSQRSHQQPPARRR